MQEKLVMLVVDDVDVNRASFRAMFEQEYRVLEAADGRMAMETLKTQKVDIVILDVYMPEVNGPEVLSQMKANSNLRDIPVIVKTAIDENMEIKMLEKGADDFIFSPCEPEIVKNRVKNIMKKYVSRQVALRRQLEAERYLGSVRENFIVRITKEIKSEVEEIITLSGAEQKDGIRLRAEHLLSLVDGVLADCDIESEESGARRATFRVQELAGEIAKEYTAVCKRKGVGFQMESSEIPHEILVGSGRRLKQIWSKMLDKAYLNTPPGESICTSCALNRIAEREVELEITVHGRVDQNDSYPIVKSAVELMRGSMVAEPIRENEVVFTIKLPFGIGKEPVTQKTRLDHMRALVLDDDELTRSYQAAILMRLGISCDAVENGADAVSRLWEAHAKGSGYDICFINWYMFGGTDFVREIRGLYTPNDMIIACSTNEKERVGAEMKAAGVDYILDRPVYQSTLYHFLTGLCGGNSQKETATRV